MPRGTRGKYLQYKADTRDLSTWLARAAIHHGYPAYSFTPSDRPLEEADERRTVAQLRNAKKKKQARAKAKGLRGSEDADPPAPVEPSVVGPGNGADETSVKGQYLIKMSSWVPIAQSLAEKQMVVDKSFMKLLRRCIALRASYVKGFTQDQNADVDEKHLHFISVLLDVESILAPLSSSPVDITSADPSTLPSLANRFAALSPTAEPDEDMPDIQLAEPPRPLGAPDTSSAIFAMEETADEVVLALLSFYADVRSVRDALKPVWRDYRARKIDLMTACVITNTAMELLRGSCEDVVDRSKPYFEDLLVMLSTLSTLLSGNILVPPPLFSLIDEDEVHTLDVYDHLLIPNFQILAGLADVVRNDTVLAYKPGYFGTYDPNLKFGSLSIQHRLQQCQILLCESFSDYQKILMIGERGQPKVQPTGLRRASDNYYFFDEMAREFDAFLINKKPTLHLLVVSQIYLDIHMTLGPEASRGWSELRAGCRRMLNSLDEKKRTENGVKIPWPEQNDKALESFQRLLGEWSRKDPLAIMWQHTNLPRHERPGADACPLDRHPFFCGLFLFRLQMSYQHLGFTIANAWGTILYSAHLYNACEHSGTLGGYGTALFVPGSSIVHRDSVPMPEWSDMDLIIEMHGKKDIFGGQIPTTIDESYDCYLDMMGVSLDVRRITKHMYTGAQRPDHLLRPVKNTGLFSDKGPQGLQDRTELHKVFQAKYLEDPKNSIKVDISVIEKLLADIRTRQDEDEAKKRRVKGMRRVCKHKTSKFSIV